MTLNDAHKLAYSLMIEHGITAKGWHFYFDKAIRRFGCTHYQTKQITLSKTLVQLNDETTVKNVILHEIAHVLAGHANGHNHLWRNQAAAIGCDAARTYSSAAVVTPPKRFVGTCPNCHRSIKRNRRTGIACGQCCDRLNGGRYDAQYLFVWTRNEE